MNSHTVPQRPHSLFIFVRGIEKLVVCIGKTVAWLNLLLVGVILIQVSMRYIFNYNSVAMEELQWHLYAVGIMMGLSYALTTDNHVRLDLFHTNFSRTTKEWIDMVGLIILVLPWCYVVISHGMDFASAAWRVSERSNSPGGLSCYWIIKSVLPISFGMFFLAALARIARAALYLTGSIERNEQHGA